jgi:Protein of unknown function (DUF2281)
MVEQIILKELNLLPETLKIEVLNFIEYLKSKRKKEAIIIKKRPVFGYAKGTFVMSPDFDEPLEDFKDYM